MRGRFFTPTLLRQLRPVGVPSRAALAAADVEVAGPLHDPLLEPRDEAELGRAFDRILVEDGPWVVPVKVEKGRAEGKLDRDVIGYTRRFTAALAGVR